MNFKYYDVLSSMVLGYAMLCALFFFTDFSYDKDFQVGYLAIAYIVGYLLNAVSSLLECFYNCIICGKPSDNLLIPIPGQNYTGYWRVKFYEAEKAIQLLREELNDANASTAKMFGKAMAYSNNNEKSRVPDFNAQYAFSRSMLTLVIIVTVLAIIKFPCCRTTYAISIPTVIVCWNRFKERGYYYAKEVLTEYVKQKTSENQKS